MLRGRNAEGACFIWACCGAGLGTSCNDDQCVVIDLDQSPLPLGRCASLSVAASPLPCLGPLGSLKIYTRDPNRVR